MKVIQHLRAVIISILLFVLLIVINLFQMSSLIFFPFDRKLFRRFNRGCANLWWGLCETVLRRVQKIEVINSGDQIPTNENALVICNHQSMADIPILFGAAKGAGRLGDMKWFVKDVLKYVPGMGWGMLFLDCIFVKRNWHADKDKIHQTFKKFYSNNIPVWPVIFPEGTRFRPHKLKRVQEICLKKNLPLTHFVLTPRAKGFVAAVQGLRGHLNSVIDFTIGYVGETPNLYQLILGQHKQVHLHIKRTPIEILPESPELIEQWLNDCFYQKDQKLAEFRKFFTFTKKDEFSCKSNKGPTELRSQS